MNINVYHAGQRGSIPRPAQQPDYASSPSSTGSQDSVFSHAPSDGSTSTQSSTEDDHNTDLLTSDDCSDGKDQIAHRSRVSQHSLRILPVPVTTNTLPSDLRQHPRRTSSGSSEPRRAPALVRQDDRKVLFVKDLVDSATSMVETIWPLSMSCADRSSHQSGVLPLRRYIEETLRRSRTSYSTLQVALYYLVLIKSHVPKHDFTMEQPEDCPSLRALQCGRRMFLAALILASKYLQDRNYSAKAWSKMSGLRVAEINANERNFLHAVNWKLHIPEQLFKRWTDIVLKYTVTPTAPAPGQSLPTHRAKNMWKSVIPMLTPELDDYRLPPSTIVEPIASPARAAASLASTPAWNALQCISSSREATPTPANFLPPKILEPQLALAPPTPALARMGPLPTPQMTPSSVASNTPAASVCSSRRPSMSMAFGQANGNSHCRMTDDRLPHPYRGLDQLADSRSSSLAPSATSSRSSPESMISDFSRSSRSSSISSVSTISISAPNPGCLARLATCRKAGLPVYPTFADSCPLQNMAGTAAEPFSVFVGSGLVESPDFASISLRDERTTPVRAAPTSVPSQESGRKRSRPRGEPISDLQLQEDVRLLLCRNGADDIFVADNRAPSPISPCISRQVLSRPSSFTLAKALQPPCSLRAEDGGRLPVCRDTGRKRTCCSTRDASVTPSGEIRMLYGEIR